MIPRVGLVTICVNEEQFLRACWEQHRDWPGLARWVFVHGACSTYGRAARGSTTGDGLSIDNTGAILDHIAADPRVRVLHYGWASYQDTAQEKCVLREAALRELESIEPAYIQQIDADEGYTQRDQHQITKIVATDSRHSAWLWRMVNFWRPPSVAGYHKEQGVTACPWGLSDYWVTGGYADVPHLRTFRWEPGLSYFHKHTPPNHNWPILPCGSYVNHQLARHMRTTDPTVYHWAFAADAEGRRVKSNYYVCRGEDQSRASYVEFRERWFDWQPGWPLPGGAQVQPWRGPVPERMRELGVARRGAVPPKWIGRGSAK